MHLIPRHSASLGQIQLLSHAGVWLGQVLVHCVVSVFRGSVKQPNLPECVVKQYDLSNDVGCKLSVPAGMVVLEPAPVMCRGLANPFGRDVCMMLTQD